MKKLTLILTAIIMIIASSCSGNKLAEKGFQVAPKTSEPATANNISGDSVTIQTRPGNVLLTGIPQFRLTTVYKVNRNKDNTTFIGSNSYFGNYTEFAHSNGNNWNNNFMPGFEAVYGYNMVNVSHYDNKQHIQKTFFDKPVLIRTLYYPSFSNDTLHSKSIKRNYFMVSVYNDDTNKDGYIDANDLRRMYLYNDKGIKVKELIPENYSAIKSEYDPENDYMYVFARLDENNNGQTDEGEAEHVFWIDLKDPQQTGRQY